MFSLYRGRRQSSHGIYAISKIRCVFFSVIKLFIGDASADSTCKDGNVRLIVVPLKPLFNQ